MYKLLYVLVSATKDLYCEQCIVSILSTKRYSPTTYISLLIDDVTEKNIRSDENRNRIFALVNECVVVNRPKGFSSMESSRFLKTKMREFIKGDFLYIDSDTIVCDSLEKIEDVPYDLAAVLDQHMPLTFNTHATVFQNHLRIVAETPEITKYDKYFNGGVLWVRDTKRNHDFFSLWNKNWMNSREKGICTDMPALAQTNYMMNFAISELTGIWNCQVWFGVNYLANAKVVHYFSSISEFSGGYNVFSEDIPNKYKQNGRLDDTDWGKIASVKSSFPIPALIIYGNDFEIYRSSLSGILRFIYRRKRIFLFLEKCLLSLRVFRSKIMLKNVTKK